MLEKRRIEQTQSRSRQRHDKALVESKNGSSVRKQLGYSPIPCRFADTVNRFTSDLLTEYLNVHRPRHGPTEYTDAKGYRYEAMITPYEQLNSLPTAADGIKPGLTFQQLDAIASQGSENEAALRL